MADQPDWVPEGLDVTVPNAARVYDCALGGYHNFAVDREFKDLAEKAWPGITQLAHANRAYLGRVVQWLVDSGIRQFLDIGSGIPTLGNVHEVAQEIAPESRVVYVDIDPVAVSHSRAILTGNPYADAIQGDLRRPEEILYHPRVLELLDFSQPVAVLMIAVLHFISDDADPSGTGEDGVEQRAALPRLVRQPPRGVDAERDARREGREHPVQEREPLRAEPVAVGGPGRRRPRLHVELEAVAADGDPRKSGDASLREGVRCDAIGCTATLANGRLVAFAKSAEAFEEDCAHAAAVLSPRDAPAACKATLIDRRVWRAQGATALFWNGDRFEQIAARPAHIDRPWARAARSQRTDAAGIAPAPRRPSVPDATPPAEAIEADD